MAINTMVQINSLDSEKCISFSSMLKRIAMLWVGQSYIIRFVFIFWLCKLFNFFVRLYFSLKSSS